MKHNSRIIGRRPRAWSDAFVKPAAARQFTTAERSAGLGLLGSLMLVSSLAFAEEPAPNKPVEAPNAQVPASGAPTKSAPTPSTLSVEEAKRQALEHQRRVRTTNGSPHPEGELPATAAAPAHAADPASPPAKDGSAHLPPGEGKVVLDPEQRAAAIAQYRGAREALVEALKAGDKKGSPELEAARAQLDLARVQLTTSRAAIEQQFRQMSPEAKQAFHAKLKELRKERAASRASRAEAHKAKVKSELGESLAKPEVRDELAAHAWRVARLERVLELAKIAGNQAIVVRAEGLMKQEKARHEKRTDEERKSPSTSAASNAKKPPPQVPPPKTQGPATDLKPKTVPSEAVQP